MSQKNPYVRRTKAKEPTNVTETVETPKPSLVGALTNAPHDPRALSVRAAETYRTDVKNYTSHERAQAQMALDFNGTSMNALTFVENTSFPGFPTLSLLAQLPEYRTMHETLADECIRCWGKVVSGSDAGDAAERVKAIEAELERIDMPAIVRQATVHDQAFGGGHIYFKLKGDEENRSLPMLMKPYSVPQGSFVGLRVVEPYWVTPNNYNSIDPTAADFYKPSSWWMIGLEAHATRLQTIISRPVADMLKPTYSFRGVSMSQLAMPYVDNWLRTRQSVSDTVKQFSISGISTDLQQMLLPGGGNDMANRAALINAYRDNRNILFLDKATEEFFQVNTPLSGLDALQAQSQEQMSAVSHIPLVKLLGITPTGLNASSEGEIRVFYDYVKGYQKNVLMSLMMNTIKVIQLSLFGGIDEHIIWEWAPLHELTALEEADARAKDADTDSKYIEQGVVTPEQVAEVLNNDVHSRYAGILDAPTSIDEVPDDDIPGITEKILEMNPAEMDGEAALGGALPATGSEPMEENETPNLGSVLSDPSITDPNARADSGNIDVHPDLLDGVPPPPEQFMPSQRDDTLQSAQ